MNNPNIKYKPEEFYNDLELRIIKHNKDYSMVTLKASYGYFEITISLTLS